MKTAGKTMKKQGTPNKQKNAPQKINANLIPRPNGSSMFFHVLSDFKVSMNEVIPMQNNLVYHIMGIFSVQTSPA